MSIRRASIVGLAMICACSSASGGGDEGAGNPDGSAIDARAETEADARGAETGTATETGTGIDAVAEADVVVDTKPDGTCKTTCGGAECGNVPDGCGGTVACPDCGDGIAGEYCETITPLYVTRVHNAISALASASPPPSYFNLADTSCGGGYKVTDAGGFVDALVGYLSMKTDVVVLKDPRDGNEIRIRAATSDAAENYHVVTSAMCSAYKYTSTCTPAGF